MSRSGLSKDQSVRYPVERLPKYMAAFLKSAEYMYACVFKMALDIQP